jgi:short-subunit dehydrogenase
MEDFDRYANAVAEAFSSLGPIDLAFIAHGVYAHQETCFQDHRLTQHLFTLNATSVITFLTPLASKMAAQGSGTLAVITSVAGDRGRPANYVYGAGKAAVSTFCQGLQAALFKHGVHVTLIKPGFVATPMTENMKLPPMLVSSPERVAALIVHGIEHRKNTLYVPGFWWWIMQIIRLIPTSLFKRMEI